MFNQAMISESIFRSARSVGNTLKKLANDADFANTRPNTHRVLASLANSYDVRGALTPNQKQLAYKLITQQLQYLTDKANSRIIANVVAPISEVSDNYESDEREGIEQEEYPTSNVRFR